MSHNSLNPVDYTNGTTQPRSEPGHNVWMFASQWEYVLMVFCCAFTVDNIHAFVVISGTEDEPTIIHHAICFFLIGLPFCYMKLLLGQYTHLGPILLKHICPIGHGMGYVFFLISFVWCTHYGLVISDFIVYLIASLDLTLDFAECPANHTTHCWDYHSACRNNCISETTHAAAFIYWKEVYMNHVTLNTSDLNLGTPILKRYAPLLVVWMVMFSFLVTGFEKLKNITRVNCFLMAICGTMLLLVCFLSDGSSLGIRLMFRINPNSLINLSTWNHAIYQCIIILGLERLCYVSYGSHMPPTMSSDVLSICTVLLLYITTFLGGIFSHALLGILMRATYLDVKNLKHAWHNGVAPYFTVFTVAFSSMGVATLWTITYFFTCIIIIFNNLLVQMDRIEKFILDAIPTSSSYATYIRAAICILCATVGSIFSSKESYNISRIIFTKVIVSVGSFNLLIVSVIVFWIYGVPRLSDDVHFFRGSQPTKFWKICWYIIPYFILLLYLDIDFFCETDDRWNSSSVYYVLSIILKLPLLIFAIYEMFRFLKIHHLLGLFQPEERWGPPKVEDRYLRNLFNPRLEIRSRRRNDNCEHKCLLRNSFLEVIISRENSLRESLIRSEDIGSVSDQWAKTNVVSHRRSEEELY